MIEGKIDGIMLDIDGTIWDTTDVVARAWNKAIDDAGVDAAHVSAAVLKGEFGKTMARIAQDLWPALDEEQRARLMAACCAEEQKAVRGNTRDLTYPGMRETVRALSARVALYIVSNCQSGYTELMMEKTGIAPYIRDFECYGRTGEGKAENIRRVMARNRLERAVYVGDTQGDADECAKAGVPFIWAAYGFGRAARYAEKIASPRDLLRIFKP